MNKLDKYIDRIYLREDFKMFSKVKHLNMIKTKLQSAVKSKDVGKAKSILSMMPRLSPEKLYKIGDKAHPKFAETYKKAEGAVSKNLPSVNPNQKKAMILAVTALATPSKDDKSVDKIVGFMKQKMMGKSDNIIMGCLSLTVAGSFIAAAFATLALWPLLFGIFIAAIGLVLFFSGV